jgi:hypothetical protein
MDKNNMQLGMIVTGRHYTENMVMTFTLQTNATKTTKVVPIFPLHTTAAPNTKGINRVGLFSAERRMGINLG